MTELGFCKWIVNGCMQGDHLDDQSSAARDEILGERNHGNIDWRGKKELHDDG